MSALIEAGAQFSACRTWRYSLWRRWSAGHRMVAFIGLNPSTADETADDPTIRRCIRFARDWGFDGLVMLNIFAFRATDPKVMRQARSPVGPDNNWWLLMETADCEQVIAAWGTHGAFLDRGRRVRELLDGELYCLGTTRAGQPRHPLYLPASSERQLWEEPQVREARP